MMIVGWPRIMSFLCTGRSNDGVGHYHRDLAAEKKEALIAAGAPVFFLPELDDEARALTEDLVKWMKRRELQRRAENSGN